MRMAMAMANDGLLLRLGFTAIGSLLQIGADGGRRWAIRSQDGGSGGVADTQLEFPLDSPCLGLLVLAKFYQQGVFAFFQ